VSTLPIQHSLKQKLSDFQTDRVLNLLQISAEHQDMLEEEIMEAEVEEAINEAHKISVQGPSSQTSTLYKLLIQEIPGIFVSAINQLVFQQRTLFRAELPVDQREKSYLHTQEIEPLNPGDFQPLSMLEVLYKMPSRILARGLSLTLPTISGNINMASSTHKP
jgi:hypothetical protein